MVFRDGASMRAKSEYTRFEKIRIIAARALQISQGAPVLVSIPLSMINPVEIAKLEWEDAIIPIDTKRRTDWPGS